jgi:hypothetical protein
MTASSPAAEVGNNLAGDASESNIHDPRGVEPQDSLLSDGPPRVQGAISPILEHEVMEYGDVHVMRHVDSAVNGELSESMIESVDHMMGSLASFVDFGRMGSKSPAGGMSSSPDVDCVTSAQLLRQPSDVTQRALTATP